jgi:hypothetical protein
MTNDHDRPEDDDVLGPCGCTDYHMSDCPTRTGYADALSRDEYADGFDPDYFDRRDA